MSTALLLIGGYGTRLRPLTLSVPKPLVPLTNEPMCLLQIRALVKAGVKKIVLAVAYKPDVMAAQLKPELDKLDVEVIYTHETTPLGTAGPLALSREVLCADNEPFFVLNADVVCNYQFEKLIAFHKNHGREGTIYVTKVEEPSRYGVVLYGEDGKIERFVEKPRKYVGNRINAGLYCFSPAILQRIEERPMSIEREVFPHMAEAGELFALDLPGYWLDVGQPGDFIRGGGMRLEHMKQTQAPGLYEAKEGDEFEVIQPVMVHPSARVGRASLIGPNVVIGPNCQVGMGVRLKDATLMEGVQVGNSSWINNSIIGWESRVGSWCRIDGVSVLGKEVTVRDELLCNGAKVLPNKEIKDSIPTPAVIL